MLVTTSKFWKRTASSLLFKRVACGHRHGINYAVKENTLLGSSKGVKLEKKELNQVLTPGYK